MTCPVPLWCWGCEQQALPHKLLLGARPWRSGCTGTVLDGWGLDGFLYCMSKKELHQSHVKQPHKMVVTRAVAGKSCWHLIHGASACSLVSGMCVMDTLIQASVLCIKPNYTWSLKVMRLLEHFIPKLAGGIFKQSTVRSRRRPAARSGIPRLCRAASSCRPVWGGTPGPCMVCSDVGVHRCA